VALVERNTRDLLNDPKIREPWPEFFVEWNAPRDLTTLDELAQVLNAAQNEKPLQEFYAKHPYLLAIAFRPHCRTASCLADRRSRSGQLL